MPRWYDKEVKELEKQYEEGYITQEEFRDLMRDLNNELRDEAEQNAERAYNDTFGNC